MNRAWILPVLVCLGPLLAAAQSDPQRGDADKNLFGDLPAIDSVSLRAQTLADALASVHKMCRLMGGDISVRSEPGKGSTFTMRIPATRGAR